MNYEEKYKQVLKRAKTILELTDNPEEANGYVFTIFPELLESEDEKIRNFLIKQASSVLESMTDDDEEVPAWKSALAWLEKQGEKQDYNPYKATIESIAAMVEKYANGDLKDFYDNIKVKCKDAMEYDKTWNEKQGEQNPADKVESKFNVGDWITNGEYTWKVTDIKPLDYILQSPNGDVVDDAISYVDEHFHLWTIQDAKDGDVLVYEGEIFMIKSYVLWHKIVYHCCYDGKNLHKHSIYDSWRKEDFDKVHPATKEQREFLFQKMKEAGYEWDAEKKELKKIEQKPAWSEEDEDALDIAIRIIQNGGDDCAGILDSNKALKWLKSLKPNHWKPSEEQMEAFEHFVRSIGESGYASPYDDNTNLLYSLINDLKNL